jgi:hypothetical protein
MKGIGRVGIGTFWAIEHPVITVFRRDIHKWVEIVANKVSFKLYKDNMERVRKYVENDNYKPLKRMAEKAAEVEVSRINDKIIGERYIVLVEGGFGTGERYCSVEYISNVIDSLWSELTVEILRALTDSIWTEEEISKQGETIFEYTLRNYIPAIFKNDLSEWEEDVPNYIVYKILRGELNWDSPEQMIREEVSDRIDRIAEKLTDLNIKYINLVGDVHPMRRTATCQIVPIEEFVDRLYKMAYNKSLEILAMKQNES